MLPLDLAYGFNFYYKANVMLLRFNSDYHQKYIKDTIRHSTFEQIEDLDQVKQIILQQSKEKSFDQLSSRTFRHTYDTDSALKNTITTQNDRIADLYQRNLIKIIDCYPDSAYYKLNYRVGDNNVIMRLRSWGFNIEVIFPWNLRQKIKEDLAATHQLYL